MDDRSITVTDNQKAFLSGFKNISFKRSGILTYPYPKLAVQFDVVSDLTPLFPYINAKVNSAQYFGNPDRIQFMFKSIQCSLYRFEIIAAAFRDQGQALNFGKQLLTFLNSVYDNRDTITPDYSKINYQAPLLIYKILPKTNCGECGLPSCLAFASAVSRSKASVSLCPGVAPPIEKKAVYPIIDDEGRLTTTVELDMPDQKTVHAQQQEKIKSLLTEREIQVLRLLAQGFTNPEISDRLCISPHTVKTHVVHIYEKLNVNDRTQAGVLASRYNLI